MRRYGKYEPLAFPWLPEIPIHWDVKKFRYLFSFSRGLSITKGDLKDKGIPCVNYGEIHSKYGFEVDPDKHPLKCVSEEFIESSPDSLLSKGDFVFADTSEDIEGSGNFTYLNSDIPTFAGYHTIIAKPAQNFSYRYMAYHFESIAYRTQIRRVVNGTKVYSITQSILKSTEIVLPPIEEQTVIANYLDEKTAHIDTLIEKKQKLIELLKEERKAIVNNGVSGEGKNWERKKLKYVAKMQSGFAFSSDDFVPEGIQLIKIGNLYQNEFSLDRQPTYLPESFATEYKEWLVGVGDILMSMTGTLGKRDYGYAIQITDTDKKFLLNQRVSKIQFDGNQIIPEFGLHILRSEYFLDQLFLMPSGTKQGNFSNEQVLSLSIVYPKDSAVQLSILKEIDNEVGRIDHMVSQVQKEVELILEYKISLVNEVVTGKIKVI